MSACLQTNSIAGDQRLGVAPTAADLEHRQHALVTADGHADLFGRGLDAEDQHANHRQSALDLVPARRPRPTRSALIDDAAGVAVGLVEVEAHQHVIAERSSDHVAPLDQHDAVGLEQLGERQIGDLVMRRQPVDVGVVQRHPPGGVAVHQGERRRRDRLGHADRLAEPLGEGGLAGAHLAGEHDEIAAASQAGQGRGDGRRRRQRVGTEMQHDRR